MQGGRVSGHGGSLNTTTGKPVPKAQVTSPTSPKRLTAPTMTGPGRSSRSGLAQIPSISSRRKDRSAAPALPANALATG